MRLGPYQVVSPWVDAMADSIRQSTRCVQPLAFPRDVGVVGLVVLQFLGDELEQRVGLSASQSRAAPDGAVRAGAHAGDGPGRPGLGLPAHPLVLDEYIDRYDTHRPHRALRQSPPAGRGHPAGLGANVRVLRRDRLGGLIREYAQIA